MDRFEDAKLRIKEGNDLVALIEQYQPLRPRGRTLVSLCPFHAENSPSFTVFRETQHFYCFGCGKTGDVFTWLMERDGLTFPEAMEVLGERAGISLEGVFQKGASRERQQTARNAYEALARVADFFHRSLLTPAGKPARDYLEARGLDEAMVPWLLGYHPFSDGPHAGVGGLRQFAREQELPSDVLEQAGLLRNGREIFAGRLMFPIVDERGRTVGFGGRLVPGAPGSEPRGDYKPPKYLNSPESPFFSKRRVLYGLRAAKQAGERRLVVMEGYTDVIACHLAGFPGAVASLGTAFTAEHARTVERYADQGVVLMFDGDRAGKQAAERAHRELINSQLVVRIAMVADGASHGSDDAKDPADIVLPRPGEDAELVGERQARFADTIDGAQDAMTVWFRLLRQRMDLSQAVNVEAAARECAALLEQVEVPVRRAALTEEMARHLAVPAPALKRLLRDAPRSHRREPDPDEALLPNVPVAKPTLLQRTEAEMLACVLAQPDLLIGLDFEQAPLQVSAIAQLFEWSVEALAIGRDSSTTLFRYLFTRAAEQPGLQSMLALAHERAAKMADATEVLAGIISGRLRVIGGSKRRDLREQLRAALAAGDVATANELQDQLLQNLRRDRPRSTAAQGLNEACETASGDGGSGPVASRPAPIFGLAAKAAAAAAEASSVAPAQPHSHAHGPAGQPGSSPESLPESSPESAREGGST